MAKKVAPVIEKSNKRGRPVRGADKKKKKDESSDEESE